MDFVILDFELFRGDLMILGQAVILANYSLDIPRYLSRYFRFFIEYKLLKKWSYVNIK